VGKRGQEWLGKKGWKGKRGLGKRVMVGNRRGGLIFGKWWVWDGKMIALGSVGFWWQ
jgi:hypothetical protein